MQKKLFVNVMHRLERKRLQQLQENTDTIQRVCSKVLRVSVAA